MVIIVFCACPRCFPHLLLLVLLMLVLVLVVVVLLLLLPLLSSLPPSRPAPRPKPALCARASRRYSGSGQLLQLLKGQVKSTSFWKHRSHLGLHQLQTRLDGAV